MTNYLDVISSWCYWAIPAWQELQQRYRDSVDFRWKIALMDKSALPPTREHTEWFYRRSGMLMRSPVMLNASWVEPGAQSIWPRIAPRKQRAISGSRTTASGWP